MDNPLREQVDAELAEVRRKALRRQKRNSIIKTCLQIFLPAIIILILLNNVIGIAPVYGESMEPSLYENDWIVFNRLDQIPEREDIIVAMKDSSNRQIIKRVIGLPGETIDIRDGSIYINDVLYDESNFLTKGETYTYDIEFPVTLGSGEYLVLGDNREVSLDSRSSATGMIQQNHLLGKVVMFVRIYN